MKDTGDTAMISNVFRDSNGGWIGAVARLGLPVVLALGLTYFLVMRVETTQALIITNQATIAAAQVGIMASISEARATMTLFSVDQQRDTRIMTGLLLQTCLNTSASEAARAACVAVTIGK